MLLDLRDGIYADDFVITAIAWLDLFSLLSGNRLTVNDIESTLGVVQRPLDVLLTLLASLGLVERKGDVLANTAVSEEHLVSGRPGCLVPFFASQKNRPACVELFEVLKTGEPAAWSSRQGSGDWESLMGKEPFASGFTAAMDSRGEVLAPAMATAIPRVGYTSLLDIAGGSGIYACAVLETNDRMKAAVLEKPPVDELTRKSVDRLGFSDRVEVLASDMFTADLPGGFDVHLYSHVLHDWDEADVRVLLSKSFESLNPGGMVVIHDAHLNAGKTGPLPVARFSVLLMHSTKGKCYSVKEIGGILEELGFREPEFTHTVGNRSVIMASKPE